MTRIKYCEKRVKECQQKVDALRQDIDTLEDMLRRGTDPMLCEKHPLITGEQVALRNCIVDLRHQLQAAQQQIEGWKIAYTVSLQ